MEEKRKENSTDVVEEDKENKEKKSNVFINIIILLVIIFVSIVMYAKYAGTKGLVVKEYRIKSSLIPSNFSGVKIIYISDILYGSTVDLDDVKDLSLKVNELKPDIVLFGGGLILEDYKISKDDKKTLIEYFSNIEASLGKYAVRGGGDSEEYDELLTSMGFLVLNNEYDLIYRENNEPICLSGIGSYNLGSYDLVTSFNFLESNPNCYSIAFTHEADILDKLLALEHKPNVLFAGNTLGGEITLPYIGPITILEGSSKYFLDYYEIDGIVTYISSGLGTKKYDMRLLNKPSFNFFRLKSEN